MKNMRRPSSLRLGAFILLAGVILGLIIASGLHVTKSSQSSPTQSPIAIILGSQELAPKRLLSLQNTSDAFVAIAELVVPTVVAIQSSRLVTSADLERFHDREELRDFFRFRVPHEFRQLGSGSGIIVSREGHILTNVHVIEGSEKIRVTLYDNREFEAKIVGLDPLTEVAVLKIEAENLPVARLGDSDKIKVGEWVLAIGNPLELRSTVTAGIVSAKERQIDIIRDTYSVENFLQTDAAINPGNSGGALVNLHAEVIGVNTAIATETGYNAGFGFAIPINLARKIMSDLIQKGRVERGYLGVAMQNIDEKKARALSIGQPRGVFIDRVFENGPAAVAGVKPKDVIIKIDNREVNKSNQVQAIVAEKSPNESILLTLFRKGQQIEVNVKLGQRETETVELARNVDVKKYSQLGISCEAITRERARELYYFGKIGVVVTNVERWSPADEAGIREDDIIVEINDLPIRDKADFYRVVSGLDDGSVSIFTIVRGEEEFHIFVETPHN
jgi:serine protease Do